MFLAPTVQLELELTTNNTHKFPKNVKKEMKKYQNESVENINIYRVDKTLRTPADQENPGESLDPLLMSLVKSTSISIDEGEETG